MAAISANLQLTLPASFDKVDIDVLSDNFTKIDEAMGEVVTREMIANHLETQEEGKVLDARQGAALVSLIEQNKKDFVGTEDIITNLALVSEDDTNSVVSAAVAYALKKMIEQINCGTAQTIQLPLLAWNGETGAYTATIEVEGITSNSSLLVAPAPDSYTDYANSVVRATEQGSGILTFVAETKPTANLNVNVANFHLQVL